MAKKISDKTEWDARVSGLGLRRRAGRQTWIVQRRMEGRTVRQTLGDRSTLSRGEARKVAQRIIDGAVDARPKMSLAAFADKHLADKKSDWAAQTYRSREKLVRRHLKPKLGQRDLGSIKRADVVTWLDGLPLSNGSKNLALAHLSGMMRHGEMLGYRPADSNPCKGMRRRKVGFEARYLTAEDYERLGKVLRDMEPCSLVEFIRFLCLTGCRIGEARQMRWDWVEGNRICLPNSKTGPRTIWLGSAARELVNRQPRTGAEVFQRNGKPVSDSHLRRAWSEALLAADLGKMRLHDLRHSFASVAINTGESLRTIAGLLGHADLETTSGYAKLDKTALRAAAERAAKRMAKTLEPLQKRMPQVEAKPVPVNSLAERFLRRRVSIPAFCAEHGLDEDTFRADVMAARAVRKEGRA